MFDNMTNVYLTIVLAPLAAAIMAGLFGKTIGRAGAHWVTIIGVGVLLFVPAIIAALANDKLGGNACPNVRCGLGRNKSANPRQTQL